MDNEFGFVGHQMRTPFLVKNAWVFEVVEGKLEEVLAHGDIDADDIIQLAESGRKFFIMPEENPCWGWHKLWLDGWFNVDCESRAADFARVTVSNFDFTVHGR